jgi:hypothetical protein
VAAAAAVLRCGVSIFCSACIQRSSSVHTLYSLPGIFYNAVWCRGSGVCCQVFVWCSLPAADVLRPTAPVAAAAAAVIVLCEVLWLLLQLL